MARNMHGLDDRYFSNKLKELARDAVNYTPGEMQLALQRLATVAEFQNPIKTMVPKETTDGS